MRVESMVSESEGRHSGWVARLGGLIKPLPIARLLAVFTCIQAVPFLALVIHDVKRQFDADHASFRFAAKDAANKIASGFDDRFDAYRQFLDVLASSPSLLDPGNRKELSEAYTQATTALARAQWPSGVAAFFRDRRGAQLFNTRVPFERSLPKRADPSPNFARIDPPIPIPLWLGAKYVVSDVFPSTIADDRRIVVASVPVLKSADVVGDLSLSIDVAVLEGLLEELRTQHRIERDWKIFLRDGAEPNRNVVAVVGSDVPDGMRSSVRPQSLKQTNGRWSIEVVAAVSPLPSRVAKVLGWYVGPLLVSVVLAWWLGQRIARRIAEAAQGARDLGMGRVPRVTSSFIRETAEVSQALQQAAVQRRAVEAELRDREQQLDAARVAAGVAAFQLDAASDRILWSANAEQMFGVALAAISTGAGFFERLHASDQERARDKRQALFAEGGDFQVGAFRFRADDEVDRWIILRGRVERDPDGRAAKVIGACVDVTARRLEEEHARRWQGVFDDAEFGLAHVSATSEVFLEVNSAFTAERGYRSSELRGRSLLECVPPALREAVSEQLRAIDKTGHGAFETENLRKDGTVFPVFMEVTVIRDHGGRAISRVIYARNIADLKRAEAQLRDHHGALHHRLQNLLLVVHEVAVQSARSSLEPDVAKAFEESFSPRVDALSSVHELLLDRKSKLIAVADVVRTVVAPFCDRAERLDVRGPQLVLKRGLAQDLGLALHELATNATKYGGLSRQAISGKVAVSWALVEDSDGTSRFRLTWREMDGPAVTPPARRRFGHSMLTEFMEHHGRVGLDYKPSGVEWWFDAESSDAVPGDAQMVSRANSSDPL